MTIKEETNNKNEVLNSVKMDKIKKKVFYYKSKNLKI
jgi:hypothetical protein